MARVSEAANRARPCFMLISIPVNWYRNKEANYEDEQKYMLGMFKVMTSMANRL